LAEGRGDEGEEQDGGRGREGRAGAEVKFHDGRVDTQKNRRGPPTPGANGPGIKSAIFSSGL
jgi:hypothetical protein